MKINIVYAALGLALALPLPALAADGEQGGSDRYEWRQAPQVGPRTTVHQWKRVRVPDNAQLANCDCDMMRVSTDECMKNMHRMGAARSAG
jgi:hypothetical protein